MSKHEPHEEYAGPATIAAGDTIVEVEADLRGRFEPIDGRFHWYGRLSASPALDELGSGATVSVTTEHGSAQGRLSDVDPWGRLRLTGLGRPPF
ncbi:DUF4873 domain-containing protein [Nocardioides sp. MAH-18]|uniref:DUF4873 domain-containing protein n=1 Tax=Nocardioides agri TaxID=2682843 RepID=A0A6L6XUF9_9ACTN|nr:MULTISPECIES: DUF4873 domain-containing protein [unclassified Nocardioides]MBA2956211.1 DUF4873 domain-containing protein [Nocardioides sp. CGMCC 1.13656]MVQ51054.1 DUF4873 domain-containing protein [Nocardioides sp. MAH-18]